MSFLFNGTILLFCTLFLGTVLGDIKIRKFSVGSGMILFTGIILGYISIRTANGIAPDSTYYKAASSLIANNIITEKISDIFLTLFICAVGLIAGKKLLPVLKKYGIKFVIIAMVITMVGAGGTWASMFLFSNVNSREIAGSYTGALTSTVGLSASLEAAADAAEKKLETFSSLDDEKKAEIVSIVGEPDADGKFSAEQEAKLKFAAQEQIGVGHTIGYPFGVLIVMVCITVIPKIFHIDLEREAALYEQDFKEEEAGVSQENNVQTVFFDMAAYFATLLLGCILGQIKIPLPFIGEIGLGSTGGVLIMALLLSAKGSLFGLSFRMDEKLLNVIKDIGVAFVLAVTGLRYGYAVVEALSGSGIYLALCSTLVGCVALMVGFLLGRYVFKINWFLLSGVVCGGMTSTPGLGVAMDRTKSELPAIGYGASYPFAVVCMVIFSIILESFV